MKVIIGRTKKGRQTMFFADRIIGISMNKDHQYQIYDTGGGLSEFDQVTIQDFSEESLAMIQYEDQQQF